MLETRRWGVDLRADPNLITWDGQTILLATAEFVGYSSRSSYMRGLFNIGRVHTSTDYHFEIGHFPVNQAPAIGIDFASMRKGHPPDDWTFLVQLVRTYVEPRLTGQYLDAIRAGQTVDVGKVKLNRDGFNGAGVSRRWEAVAGVTMDNGQYWIHEKGSQRAILRIPGQNQNSSLLPPLFDALKR